MTPPPQMANEAIVSTYKFPTARVECSTLNAILVISNKIFPVGRTSYMNWESFGPAPELGG
ncbi:uncharacterized protein FOMMEDRAFT_152824 [Fomitiporia mediterranea MF3/22]|uniref:uncharacterized protein n=1 Tax=Fomitiporia mediterranea (strain MF3/22) TaxID=694068 RepID=UPI0004408252|nr:uncharacterized protein FOMMEDRAFT_152824 [Fomitiporia mediterranea MF3/22]EJD05504.1 hypothetical protein FOMMEDRAFT_152824 [Fomitiporia mediterranea MF3/22]